MKYKHAGTPNEYYTIDDNGLKSQSWNKKDKPGLFKEMMDWVDDGNKIELQYTPEEQAIKDQKEVDEAAVAWIGKRKSKYPITDELIVALWEKVVEGRPESAEALEIIRQAVKKEIPKPS